MPKKFFALARVCLSKYFELEERSAFEVAGVSMLLDKSLEKNFCTVPQFWDNAVQDGTLAKLTTKLTHLCQKFYHGTCAIIYVRI